MLRGLTLWATRPHHYVIMAYEWCSVICGKYRDLEVVETLLVLSLQIGFRSQDPVQQRVGPKLFHTRHHQSMVDCVFGSQEDEVIADFLHAWTSQGPSHGPHTSLVMCAEHLVGLPISSFSSPRLRRLVVQSVGLIGYQEFEKIGVESFVNLLNHLCVSAHDVDSRPNWTGLLLGVVKSPEGRDRLSHSHWELLLELSYCSRYRDFSDYDPRVAVALQDAQEWVKLAYWICTIWIQWPLNLDEISRDLEHGMLLLFRQQPGSIEKLEEWMRRLGRSIPTVFQGICEQGRLEEEQRSISL